MLRLLFPYKIKICYNARGIGVHKMANMTIEEKYQYYGKMLETWLDIAENLLNSGAEIWRVERTIQRLAASRGVTNVNAFSINTSITLTCTFEDGLILTQTRRIENAPSVNMTALEKINDASRRYCRSDMKDDDMKTELAGIKGERQGIGYYIGGALAAGGFALFFGGGIIEALLAAPVGAVVCLFNRKLGKYFPNVFMSNFVLALLTGTLLYLSRLFIPTALVDKSIIGVIMLLIPGVAITNSLRDMIIGDTISGILKFVESIVVTIGMAIGYIAAMLITGGVA